jgi:hypothetical protein
MNYPFFTILFFAVAVLTSFFVSVYPPFSVFFVAAALLLFTVSFLNTDFGLYVLIFSMLLSPEFTVGSTSGSSLGRGVTIRVDDFLLLIIGLSWLAKNAYYKELGLFKKTSVNRPVSVYLLVCGIATGLGILGGRVDASTGFFYVLKYFEYCIVYFMLLNHLENAEQIRKFLFCIFLTAFIVSLIAMMQIPDGGRVSAPFEGESGEPNTLGGYLLFIASLAGGILTKAEKGKNRLMLMMLLAVMFFPFIHTQSRSSYLAFIPSLFVLGYMTEKKGVVLSIILALFLVSPFILPSVVKDRVLFTFLQPKESGQIKIGKVRIDTSTSARLQSWIFAAQAWTKHRIFGYGVSGFRFVDAQFPRVLIETGIAGILSFLWLLYALFRLASDTLQKLETPYFIGITRGFIAGYAGLLFHAVGANTFIIVRIMEPFWFIAAIVAVLPELEAGKNRSPGSTEHGQIRINPLYIR